MQSVVGSDADVNDRRYTVDEIREELASMAPADWARVRLMAQHFCQRSGMTADDLMQETFVRMLASRTCEASVGLIGFIAGTMRSIASEAPRARVKARETMGLDIAYVAEYERDGVAVFDMDCISPEDDALSKIFHKRALDQALACIAGDEQLQLLVEGLFEDMRGASLESLLDLDTRGLAALKRRLARKLLATFPDGEPV